MTTSCRAQHASLRARIAHRSSLTHRSAKLMPTSCAGIARNPHKCGKELLLQSTVRASPLQLMRCQRWGRIQLLETVHSFACLALLQRTPPTVARSLQCYGHSHEIAFRLHCYRACYVASLLARARLTSIAPVRLPSGCIATERAT